MEEDKRLATWNEVYQLVKGFKVVQQHNYKAKANNDTSWLAFTKKYNELQEMLTRSMIYDEEELGDVMDAIWYGLNIASNNKHEMIDIIIDTYSYCLSLGAVTNKIINEEELTNDEIILYAQYIKQTVAKDLSRKLSLIGGFKPCHYTKHKNNKSFLKYYKSFLSNIKKLNKIKTIYIKKITSYVDQLLICPQKEGTLNLVEMLDCVISFINYIDDYIDNIEKEILLLIDSSYNETEKKEYISLIANNDYYVKAMEQATLFEKTTSELNINKQKNKKFMLLKRHIF